MTYKAYKQFSIKVLMLYLISTLLFLSSIDLHIHTKKAAAVEDHGSAVSITKFTSNLFNFDTSDEIEVSPDGMLEVQHTTPDLLAVFLLLVLVIAVFTRISVYSIDNTSAKLGLPFFGFPSLRAPPF